MGRTHTKKVESREARLKVLPQSERLLKSALIKKKEGRVMDAAEKHALKMASEHGEIIRLWEKLRTTNTSAEEEEEEQATSSKKKGGEKTKSVAEIKSSAYAHKFPIVDQLMPLIEPKFMALLRTPSVSRVLQSMIKYGSPKQVDRLTQWVKKDFFPCATDAYGHFVVMGLIRHANRETFSTSLLPAVLPAVPQLIGHKFGVQVLHAVYSSRWSSAADRDRLLLGIFKDPEAMMKRWVGYPVLEDILAKNPPALKKRLLPRLFDLVEKLISQKEAVEYPLVQRLSYAFLKTGTREEVSELCDSLRPHLVTVATTREGAPLASLTFSLTHPKKRKEILRAFKDNLGELATSKYSAPVVARLFDLLYDVQLVKKYVANDMAEHIGNIVNSEYGFRILMHLLTPRPARKEKFLFPNWFVHNLYSTQNTSWNHHTWLTGEYEEEEVEICSRPAMASHLQVLPDLVRAFLAYAEEKKEKLNKQHAGLIAREILLVEAAEGKYNEALALSTAERSALAALSVASGVKRSRDGEEEEDMPNTSDGDDKGAEERPVARAQKKSKVEKPRGSLGASKLLPRENTSEQKRPKIDKASTKGRTSLPKKKVTKKV